MKNLSKFFYLLLITNISFAQNIDQEYKDAQKLFLDFQSSHKIKASQNNGAEKFIENSAENSKFPTFKKAMDQLALHKTKTKQHTLKQWALKNLISDSITIAVSAFKNKNSQNKNFYQFSDKEKEELITSISKIIAQSFTSSLDKVTRNLNINLTSISDKELEIIIINFLKQKFNS